MSDLVRLCGAAVEAARGREEVEAYGEESRRTQVRVREGEIESLTSSETRGVGVRVLSEGRLGYAYAADPDEEDVRALVVSARESAGFTEPDPGNVLPDLEPVEDVEGIHREGLELLDPDRRVALALDVERAAVETHPEVRRVEAAGYGDAVTRVAVASTSGAPLQYGRTDCWAFAVALGERNGEVQTGFAYRLAREVDELDWEAGAREAAERAARLLGSVKPPSERLPVVLDPVASTAFLGVLSSSLSAESVLKGRSLLANRIGQQVASDAVVLVDDGRFLEGPAVAPFDGEGVATARTPLITAGILQGFLHDTATAARTGGGARSTGNAARGSHRTPPGVSPSNLYLEPGPEGLDELLAQAGRAVYVQEVTGLHSGANPVSGEFSVGGHRTSGGRGSPGAASPGDDHRQHAAGPAPVGGGRGIRAAIPRGRRRIAAGADRRDDHRWDLRQPRGLPPWANLNDDSKS